MRVLLFVEALGAVLGSPHDRPENGSFPVSGLIAGLQPSKSDFRNFSKLLPSQFLLQIKLFRGPRLPKLHFKVQKSKIELKMSKNGFGHDASDWENCALRTAPASLQNFWQIQTGRYSAFCLFVGASGAVQGSFLPTIGQKMARSLESYVSGLIAGSQPSKIRFSELFQTFAKPISASSRGFLVKQFEANTCSARRIAARPSHPTKEGWPPDRPLTFCWGLLSSRSGQLLTRAGKHTACRTLKRAHAR